MAEFNSYNPVQKLKLNRQKYAKLAGTTTTTRLTNRATIVTSLNPKSVDITTEQVAQ